MSDQDIIKQAYADALKKLFAVFFESFSLAGSDAERDLARQRFKAGLALARSSRDAAIALL